MDRALHFSANFFFLYSTHRDRYEVVEPTTKRPVNQKPQQDDEYFGGSEIG